MIKGPPLHDTESFDTSLPAVVRKSNMSRCVGDEISICVTSLPFCKSWSRDLCRRISKCDGLSAAVCSAVAPAGRKKSIMHSSGGYEAHVRWRSQGRLQEGFNEDPFKRARRFKGLAEDTSGFQLRCFSHSGLIETAACRCPLLPLADL